MWSDHGTVWYGYVLWPCRGAGAAALRLHLEQQATVAAYQDCFLLMGGLGVLIIPMVLLLRR